MKEKNVGKCPGCGRHCPLSEPECGYGRKLTKKHAAQTMEHGRHGHGFEHKWEAFVEHDGLAWKLLTAGRNMKHALRDGVITESDALAPLSDDEKIALAAMLDKLNSVSGSRRHGTI